MQQRFNPTLSWDGVAIITACVVCCVWFGSLKETVRQQGEELHHHADLLQTQGEALKLISQNIAVLQTMVNERTKNGNGDKKQ